MNETQSKTAGSDESPKYWCDTCEGVGHIDERLGGEHFSNPKAECPDCDGNGYWIPRATLSHPATQAGALQAVTDPQLLDLSDDYKSTYQHGGTTFDAFDAIGFARAVLTLAATQPNAAPGDATFEPAFLDTGKLRAADLHRIWQRVAPQGTDRAALQWHVAQFAHAVQTEAAPAAEVVADLRRLAAQARENPGIGVAISEGVAGSFCAALAAPTAAIDAREQPPVVVQALRRVQEMWDTLARIQANKAVHVTAADMRLYSGAVGVIETALAAREQETIARDLVGGAA